MYLPTAPDFKEKLLFSDPNKLKLYSLGLPSFLCLMSGMTLFAVQHPYTWVYMFYVVFMFFYLGLSYAVGFWSLGHTIEYLPYTDLDNKSVDVFLPSAGEDLEIIENTYKHVAQLEWPIELLKIHVLDDSHRDAVKKLADKYGFNYIARPNPGRYKKAGNLRWAFRRTSGQYILILDADFCPSPHMLKNLMPYFKDEKVGIVQSPQFFTVDPAQTWVEKGASYVQEFFYRLTQFSRDYFGGAICVGTNALYRRSALTRFGGTARIDYSEDVHTGFKLLNAGWKIKYININLAKGTCPSDRETFFRQQYRWAMGSISLGLNPAFWLSKLTVAQKACYVSGMLYYVATALGVLLNPIPGIIMLWFFPEYVKWANWLYVLPSFLYGYLWMPFWTKLPFTRHVYPIRRLQNVAHLFAIKDKLFGSILPWVPSGVKKKTKSFTNAITLLSVITVLHLVLVTAGAVKNMSGMFDLDFWPIILLTLIEAYIVGLVVFSKDS